MLIRLSYVSEAAPAGNASPAEKIPQKTRKKLLRGLTGNALTTSVVAALVSGVTSFYVAHWQSQDALRQAVISQQVQQLIKLEADAQSFDAAVYTEYSIALECRKGSASACNQVTGPSGDKMVNAEVTLDIDKGNISDTFIRKDIDTLIDTGLAAASPGSTNENSYVVEANAYFNLTARCGRLIQGG